MEKIYKSDFDMWFLFNTLEHGLDWLKQVCQITNNAREATITIEHSVYLYTI